MNLIILDGFSVAQTDLNWDALSALTDTSGAEGQPLNVVVHDRTRPEETIARCVDADAVFTNKVLMPAEVIDALPRLRYIGVLATGYNVVDLEAARRRGIVVTNIPAYSTASVAQLVFAHLLNITNSVAHYAEANRQPSPPSQRSTANSQGPTANSQQPTTNSPASRWVTSPDFTWADTPLTELAGKTFGIYGLGNIGSAVARIALAFGMKVIAVTSRQPEALPVGVESVSWDTLLKESDVISLHCPLTPETQGMINADALGRIKPSAILINTGRGPLVDEQAVADALCENRLSAFCADVLSTEPPSASNPLLSAPRCYLTPHIAWATREARIRLMNIAIANLRAFVEGRPTNVVNR